MKTTFRHAPPAFTLLEMSIVIMVLLALIGTGLFTFRKYDEWKLGRAAGVELRNVYSAQRMYLADNPTAAVAGFTAEMLIPYLPNGAGSIPTVKSITGANLAIVVNQCPPVINAGTGAVYDPSGSNKDSLWDAGE
jgi:type II secretory pathway pseudopilin PulG